MNFNVSLFFKINNLLGKNRWLDLFGKAGAEWVIVAMLGWFLASVYLTENGDGLAFVIRALTLLGAWFLGWVIDILIGKIVKEPRPHITYPESKLMFRPLMSWKSFPSDHAMTAWLIFFIGFMFNLVGIEGLGILALWVSWGRVFAGLHYPFDIVGGMSVAAVVTMISYNVLLIYS